MCISLLPICRILFPSFFFFIYYLFWVYKGNFFCHLFLDSSSSLAELLVDACPTIHGCRLLQLALLHCSNGRRVRCSSSQSVVVKIKTPLAGVVTGACLSLIVLKRASIFPL
jgi:hypothetical protein